MTLVNNANKSKLKLKLRQNDHHISILMAEDLLVEWSLITGKSLSSINRSSHINNSSPANCPGCHDRTNMVGIPQKHKASLSLGEKIAELKFYAGLVSPTIDAITLIRILNDLGVKAKAVVKKIDNKSHECKRRRVSMSGSFRVSMWPRSYSCGRHGLKHKSLFYNKGCE